MIRKWKNRILPKGITVENGYVTLRLLLNGKRYKKRFGQVSRETLDAAERKLNELNHKVDRGEDGEIIPSKPILTPAAIDLFIEHYGSKKGKMYKYNLSPFKEFFKHHYYHTNNYLQLEAFKKDREAEGLKGSAINKNLSTYSKMYEMFVRWQMLKVEGIEHYKIPKINPVKFVAHYNESKYRRNRILSNDELRLIAKHSNPQLLRIIIAALSTALRYADVVRLSPQSFIETFKKIHGVQGKTGREYNLPESRALKFLLSSAIGDRLVDGTNFRRNWSNMVKKVKAERPTIEHFEFRDIRRTALRGIYDKTKDIIKCRDIAGHSRSEQTEHYLGVEAESLADAGQVLDGKALPLIDMLEQKSANQNAQKMPKTPSNNPAKLLEMSDRQ